MNKFLQFSLEQGKNKFIYREKLKIRQKWLNIKK